MGFRPIPRGTPGDQTEIFGNLWVGRGKSTTCDQILKAHLSGSLKLGLTERPCKEHPGSISVRCPKDLEVKLIYFANIDTRNKEI